MASAGAVVLAGSAVVVDGVGNTSYAWARLSGIGGSLNASNVRQPTFSAPVLMAGDPNRSIVYRLTATNNGVSDTDTVSITVEAPGSPPATDPPATEPPATEPPATEPPVTEPPVTEPPVTEPPATDPPATDPPATDPPPPPLNVVASYSGDTRIFYDQEADTTFAASVVVAAAASGGVPPYAFTGTGTRVVSIPGTYTFNVSVTDNNGTIAVDSVQVTFTLEVV